jgi:UDP-glucose 4-epimerase
MSIRTLVTGGHGFIGKYVVERLLASGREVMVLDPHSELSAIDGVDHWFGDIRDAVMVTEAMAHADSFIHLGGVLGTQETIQNPRPAAQTNILGGLNIFEAAAQYGLPGVNIAVGNWWMNNTYSISKNAAERFAMMFNAERDTKINIVRALNAYGPRQIMAAPYGPGKVRKIMPAFVARALTGTPIEIYGDGSQVMDMIYVDDVAMVLVRALEMAEFGQIPHHVELQPDGTEQEVQTIIEAGSCVDTTVLDIANEVLANVDDPKPLTHLPMRPGEPPSSVVLGRADKLAAAGFEPSDLVSLSEGVRRTVQWFAENEGLTWDRP